MKSKQPAIHVCFGIVWIESNRFVEIGEGAIEIVLRHPGNSAIVVGHDMARSDFNRSIEITQSTLKIAPIEAKISAVIPRCYQVSVKVEGAGVILHGLRYIAMTLV